MKADIEHEIEFLKEGFVAAINKRFGIVIQDHQISIMNKILAEACEMFKFSARKCLEELNSCPEFSPLFEHVVSGITVTETYFFRDRRQIASLREVILPKLILQQQNKNTLNLRIWSAACSTGPEIYTIAIMLLELMPDIKNWSINLLGTDINLKAMQIAQSGVYGKWALRSVSEHYLDNYFTQNGNEFILSPRIREMVKFSPLNLVEGRYPSMINGTFEQHLIVCRNALIYFDNETISRIMKNLTASLTEGGILLLGASDPHLTTGTGLINHRSGHIFFSKPYTTPILSPLDTTLSKSPLTNSSLPGASTKASASSATKKIIDKKEIEALLAGKQWKAVLDAIVNFHELNNELFVLKAKASAYINLSDFEAAARLFDKNPSVFMTDRDAYFLYATCLLAISKNSEAEKALKQAIFLDNQFVAGHYRLGQILLRENRTEQGIKSFTNALSLVQKKSPDDKIPCMAEVTCGQLEQIIKSQLRTLTVAKMNGNK